MITQSYIDIEVTILQVTKLQLTILQVTKLQKTTLQVTKLQVTKLQVTKLQVFETLSNLIDPRLRRESGPVQQEEDLAARRNSGRRNCRSKSHWNILEQTQ